MELFWNNKRHEFDPEQRVLILENEGQKSAMLYMPGLPFPVQINISGPRPVWAWDGDVYKPTFSPSILTQTVWGPEQRMIRNHVFVKHGIIMYQGDCTHEYAGKTAELPRLCDWPEDMRLWD